MPADLTWLIGKRLAQVTKQDFTWFFTFQDGGRVLTESGWRLVTRTGIDVTSEDHDQMFGLKEPVDASARVIAATEEKKILGFRLAERTSDLAVTFEDEVLVEFLNLSCGYESWRAYHGSEEVICMGGGGVAHFSNKRAANQTPELTAPSGRGSA